MKTPRSSRDYGLPPLTIEEAARVLGIRPSEFRDWIDAKVAYTKQQWSNWVAAGRAAGLDVPVFPEAFVRLYLTRALETTEQYQVRIQALRQEAARAEEADRAREQREAAAAAAARTKKSRRRATG